MKTSVLIPTYKRPKDLLRCLEALARQTQPVDEVLLVVRDTDNMTRSFLKETPLPPLPIKIIDVSKPGMIAAMNAGLDRAVGDFIAFTDDDAAPMADWVARIQETFDRRPDVGGVGGRDRVFVNGRVLEGREGVVGIITWWGGWIGNHHLGVGGPREVDLIKGVNMSYRRSAVASLRVDERLRGTGAQYRADASLCLAVRKAGWKLIYDPDILVDHYAAERVDKDDKRENLDALTIQIAVHNTFLLQLEHSSLFQKGLVLLYSVLLGTRRTPGLALALWQSAAGDLSAFARMNSTIRGLWQAFRTWRVSK